MTEKSNVKKERRILELSRTTSIAVIAIALLTSLVIIKPALPKKIVLLTGPEGGGYHALGTRYAEHLDQLGLQTEVKVTRGGFENVQQLIAGAENTIAFAPSNIEHVIGDSEETDHLVTLGSIAYEPLWLFFRSDLEVRRIPDLAGLRVVTGAEGTVVKYMVQELLELNGVADLVEIQGSRDQTPEAVVDALAKGDVDAAFATGGPASPVIKGLLGDPHIKELSFDRAEAYQALQPGLAKIVAPEGIFDLARNIPSEDLALIATTTNLVTLESLNSSVAPLILRAAAAVQRKQRVEIPGEGFPGAANVTLPLHRAASRYYDQGEKGLSKILPYEVVRRLNHLGSVVLPLLTLAFVLIKIAPTALKIWGNIRLVGQLKGLEAVEKAHAAGGDREQLLADLDLIDQKSAKMFVARSIVHDYIDFRQFLHDMRDRVEGS